MSEWPSVTLYACKVCGVSPRNRGDWCGLGCGSDFNEMIPINYFAASNYRGDLVEFSQTVDQVEQLDEFGVPLNAYRTFKPGDICTKVIFDLGGYRFTVAAKNAETERRAL